VAADLTAIAASNGDAGNITFQLTYGNRSSLISITIMVTQKGVQGTFGPWRFKVR